MRLKLDAADGTETRKRKCWSQLLCCIVHTLMTGGICKPVLFGEDRRNETGYYFMWTLIV